MHRRTLLGLAAGLAMPALHARADSAPLSLRVGIMSGPEEDIAEAARGIAAAHGLTLKLVTFEDYTLPNEALASGDIDANAFEHKPFLDSQIQARGYHIVPLGLTYVEPMGIYSKKLHRLDALADGARIAVQNDPSNQGRALNLLAAHGLIALAPGRGLLPSLADVTGSAKHLRLIELDAAQLPRALDDVAMASINTNYAVSAGLDPAAALIREPRENNPYANMIAVRAGDTNRAGMKTLLASYQSPEMAAFLASHFKGAILPSF
ncbi:MetQ/NlpA family ABC transporter substrate-binding protein [Lichenicola cladoniae]|uniref:MetQ/NlpA family ABC transporter substrate-binding protein n=1 Tax=Lichenicola cladoniae TaxID=1484109 RepID=A0A6M8HVD3_9PROT|nr:MetQ/NlpA family ABC transporter substrate-binding protein [Lichenicola cladoniae]NPD66253.1 MetQ/NlpA family ABC transporter substrate-binding protein [Acetobacteraceae bacterium]QKE92107.1 MetQ/NlpA family ABC transporter substrate-binding protein [Lichenicola cladoniae]